MRRRRARASLTRAYRACVAVSDDDAGCDGVHARDCRHDGGEEAV